MALLDYNCIECCLCYFGLLMPITKVQRGQITFIALAMPHTQTHCAPFVLGKLFCAIIYKLSTLFDTQTKPINYN